MKLRKALRYLNQTVITASTMAEKDGAPKATSLAEDCAGKTPRNLQQVELVANDLDKSLESLLLDKLNPEPLIVNASQFSRFFVNKDGWHSRTLEVCFRHISRGSKS